MKRSLYIGYFGIVLSFCYSSFGISLGSGENGGSFGMGFQVEGNWFFMIETNMSGISEDNIYDFSPELFDDEERGKIKDCSWVVFGKSFDIFKNNKFFLGGGYSVSTEYYKRYDSSEIPSDSGIYYITDDNSGGTLPTLYFGIDNLLILFGKRLSVLFE